MLTNCFLLHYSGPGCVTSNVKVEITGPATEDMLLHKKGTLTCRVTVQKDEPQIIWEDEKEDVIASKPMIKENGETYLSKLDITYDEWSRGVKRYCVVHHSDLLTPSREPYEREFGKKNTLKQCLVLIDILISKTS